MRTQGAGGVEIAGEVRMASNPVPQSEVTTEEKRRYLRKWAKEMAGNDPGKLPIIREAKAEIKRHFGDVPGAGLGTDLITRELRAVRDEISRVAKPNTSLPEGPEARLLRLAHIAQLMIKEGVQELRVSLDGDVVSLKKFDQS